MIRTNSDPSVDVLRERFLSYQERQQMAIRADDIPAANRHFRKIKQYAEALAGTPEGRDALEELTRSPLPFVRLRAAQYARNWAPHVAIPVLGRLVIENFSSDLSPDERIELRISAKHSLFFFFGVRRFDQNELIEPLKAYGIDLPYEDHSVWQ